MLIGSKSTTNLMSNLSDLSAYCESLIPEMLKGNLEILNNQKFYIALILRANTSLSYEKRKDYCDKLLKDVYITGDITKITEINEVLDYVDINKLVYQLHKEIITRKV